MAVTYSPLCDTDLSAYEKYLGACRELFRNGWSTVIDCTKCGRGHAIAGGNSGVDVGGCVVCAHGDQCTASRGVLALLGPGLTLDGDTDVTGRNDGDTDERGEDAASGFSGGDVVGSVGGVSGHVGSSERKQTDASVGQPVVSGTLPVRGPNHARNCAKREKKKNKKKRSRGLVPEWRVKAEPVGVELGLVGGASKVAGSSSMKKSHVSARAFHLIDEKESRRLQESRAQRYVVENELAVLKARQSLDLLGRRDLEQQAKCERVKIMRATEQAMVAVEKAHGTLKATGNVPGFAATVVSGVPTLSDGSISPNSSISEAEVRKLMKEHADGQAQIKALSDALLKMGMDPKNLGQPKDEWTLDSRGLPEVGSEVMAERFPEGYGMDMYECTDGKMRARIT